MSTPNAQLPPLPPAVPKNESSLTIKSIVIQPNTLSRTQQKLLLQKDQLETQEAAGVGLSSGSAAVKFAKEIERIDREFQTVQRFHDPLGFAIERARQT